MLSFGVESLIDMAPWHYSTMDQQLIRCTKARCFGTSTIDTVHTRVRLRSNPTRAFFPHVNDVTHDNPNYSLQPRYWVSSHKTNEALGDNAQRDWFFAWRDVGPTERTLVGTVIPKTAAGNTAFLMMSDEEPPLVAALVGLLSSLVLDYDARQKGARMNFFLVEQLATLRPAELREHRPWLGESASDWLASRVFELCFTNWELVSWARAMGANSPPFRWQPERRRALQGEIDAAVLHLFRLNRRQAEWLLDSFTVLRKYEEREVGDYRTKTIVLEIYDRMSEAIAAGVSYRTHLDLRRRPASRGKANRVILAVSPLS